MVKQVKSARDKREELVNAVLVTKKGYNLTRDEWMIALADVGLKSTGFIFSRLRQLGAIVNGSMPLTYTSTDVRVGVNELIKVSTEFLVGREKGGDNSKCALSNISDEALLAELKLRGWSDISDETLIEELKSRGWEGFDSIVTGKQIGRAHV